jgi:hypothetical protein
MASSRRLYVDTYSILLIIALVLSLPSSLFIGYHLSSRRARFASVVMGLIFAVATAGLIYLYINNNTISIDGLSFFLGSLFGCSVGAFIGALLANFAFGAGGRTSDLTSPEY